MHQIGYAHLAEWLQLPVRPPVKPAYVSSSVNRRMDSDDRILFPSGVSITDTPLGHVEFALRHEGVDLCILAAVFERIPPGDLIGRLRESPNGEYVRRAAFLWEWLRGKRLQADVAVTARYVHLFPKDRYVTAKNPQRHGPYRIWDNALGDRRFCPVVQRASHPGEDWLKAQLERAVEGAADARASGMYERAVQYLYLSETRGSFAIEREVPSANKEEHFVQILRRAGETDRMSEDWLVEIQNVAVRNAFSYEAGYRTRQNWLESATGRITFLPHPPEPLRETMAGWEHFVNDTGRGVDPLVKATCASFGFVYIHPFMDGNGRLHRFIIHHVLTRTGLIPLDMVIPVSAVIMKHVAKYHQVLTGFSEPVTRLWDYRRLDDGPAILQRPGAAPYRYFTADRELRFLADMIQQAVEQEIPQELGFLRGYDTAFARIEVEFDLPRKDIGTLIRIIQDNGGRLSRRKRSRYDWIPDVVLDRIESIVQRSFCTEE